MQIAARSAAQFFLGCAVLLLALPGSPQSKPLEGVSVPAAAAGSESAPWQFRRAPAPGGASEAGITAVAARANRIAIGDANGASLSIDGGSYRHVVRSDLVNDLHFAADGSLWVAALDGLQRLALDGRVSDRSPGTGELARAALRVRELGGVLAVGTAAGLFLSHDREHWSARVGSLPAAPVTALALRNVPVADTASEPAQRVEIWAVSGGFPWRLIVRPGASGVQVIGASRVSIPGRPGGSAPVDVALGLPGAELVVAFAQALAISDSLEGPWRIIRPAVGPGASLRRVVGSGLRVWLASDRGLLEADGIASRFRRSAPPAGSAASSALVLHAGAVLVASQVGLLEGRPPMRVAAGSSPLLTPNDEPEPGIAAIHRAALRYLELGPERVRELRRGLDWRGWLPDLSLSVDYGVSRDEREDWDQAFVSGDTRRLYDYQRDRQRDLGASVELSWELGDTLYDSDAIELSREARQRIALRDDALDEINQLYFERVAVTQSK